jgi:hypothetical protein
MPQRRLDAERDRLTIVDPKSPVTWRADVPRFLASWRSALPVAFAAFVPLLLAGQVAAAPETICGRVDAVSADEATVDGQVIPLDGLDADAIAALELALNGSIDACVDVESSGGIVTEAFGVTVSAQLCGSVDPAGGTDILVDRVLIPQELLDAETFETLRFAINANGAPCLYIDVSGSGGTTTVDVHLDMEVCGTVTALGAQTLDLNGMTFDVADGADLFDVEEGDVICVFITSAEGGGVEITQRTDEVDEEPDPGDGGVNGGGGGDAPVPDTATSGPQPPFAPIGIVLILASAAMLSLSVVRPARQK